MKCQHTFIIAEIGNNHQGNIELFKKMIVRAKECGVDAVKSQKREPKECLTSEQYNRPYEGPHSFGETYGKHREALELSRAEWTEAMRLADDLGFPLFASVFDITSARFMKDLAVEMIKIGSAEVTKLELLEEVAGYSLPVLMSTGMSTLEEIDKAVEIFKANKADLTLMHCTSCYPCAYEDINLRIIPELEKRYNVPVGFSGHHSSVAIDAASVAMGAVAVERHFTLDRTMKGTDHAASLEPEGMKKVVKYIRATKLAMGSPEKRILECEKPIRLKCRGAQ
jgi:sialic acid synthase SpsE